MPRILNSRDTYQPGQIWICKNLKEGFAFLIVGTDEEYIEYFDLKARKIKCFFIGSGFEAVCVKLI